MWAALTPLPAILGWRRRNVVTRHQPSGRPELRRLTHDDENIVGGQAEMGARRRYLVCAASDRENQCAGLGTQTGGRQRLSDERRVRGETQTLHRHLRVAAGSEIATTNMRARSAPRARRISSRVASP